MFFFAFSWLRLASVGFSCFHSLIWCKYAWLFASYDSSQICLPIHPSVYIYLSFYLSVYPFIYLYFFLSFFLSFSLAAVLLYFSFCFCFFICLLCREETKQGRKERKGRKEASKQASTSCSPLDLVCCWGGRCAPPTPRPHHEICTSSPTPAPATKSVF